MPNCALSLSLSLSLPLAHTLSLSLSLMHAFFHTQPFDSRWAESQRSSKAGEQVPAVEHLGSSLCLQLRSLSSFPPLFLSLCRGHTHTHTLGFNLKCTCSTMITFSNCLSFNYLQLSVFNPDFFFLTSNEMEADLARTTSWWTHILRKLKTIAGWQGQQGKCSKKKKYEDGWKRGMEWGLFVKCLLVIHCVYMCVSLPHILTATYSVYSLSHPDYIFHFYLQTCDCDCFYLNHKTRSFASFPDPAGSKVCPWHLQVMDGMGTNNQHCNNQLLLHWASHPAVWTPGH